MTRIIKTKYCKLNRSTYEEKQMKNEENMKDMMKTLIDKHTNEKKEKAGGNVYNLIRDNYRPHKPKTFKL